MIKFTDTGSILHIGEDIGSKTGQTCTANCSAEVMCDKKGESHANVRQLTSQTIYQYLTNPISPIQLNFQTYTAICLTRLIYLGMVNQQ